MNDEPQGRLIIIGGHEAKEDNAIILNQVAEVTNAGNGHLVVITVATQEPEELGKQYHKTFTELGIQKIDILDIRTRDEASDEAIVKRIEPATTIFFTGGDQLRITSQIGDSPLFRCIRDIYRRGGTIVGTSAGAAAMPETMLIGGPSDESARAEALKMAPGLAFLSQVVIDSHFAERGRMGRLLGAVAQNPRNVGLGIDEDTAIVVEDHHFRVLGSGAVYVVDGIEISYSSLSEKEVEGVIGMADIKLHVLGHGDSFSLAERRPSFVERTS